MTVSPALNKVLFADLPTDKTAVPLPPTVVVAVAETALVCVLLIVAVFVSMPEALLPTVAFRPPHKLLGSSAAGYFAGYRISQMTLRQRKSVAAHSGPG